MSVRVATLVFLFLARIRFSKTESIPSIILRRYGDRASREVRKFEKLDYKLRKVQLDLDSDVILLFYKYKGNKHT